MSSDISPERQPAAGFRGHVRNGLVVFDEPVPLPEGAEVRVEPVAAAMRATLADLPADMAKNHDHYVHGTMVFAAH
jgi:hypothetical protein